MSKNMTRKGLAFGAGLALTASGLSAVPAYGAIEDFITLAPTTGYAGAYAVIAADGNTFSMTATPGATAIHANKELKFLVTDPEAVFEPAGTQPGRNLILVDEGADTVFIDVSENTVTIKDASGAVTGVVAGDVIAFDDTLTVADNVGFADADANAEILAAANVGYTVTKVNGAFLTFTSTTADVIEMTADAGTDDTTANQAVVDDTDSQIRVIREKRAADNSFVIDTGVANGAATAVIIEASDDVTRTVTVQAFVDFVEDDLIGQLDYVSPARTVTFVTDGDLTGSFSLTAPNEGDTALAGTFSTTPLLNGAQVNDAALLAALFTRQGDSKTAAIVVNTTAQSLVTGLWSASVNTAEATSVPAWTADAALPGGTNWGHTAPTARAAAAIGAVSVTAAKVATVNTTAAHDLKTGDKITYAAADIAVMNETAAVVTVVDSDTFTYNLSETTAVTAAEDADETAGGYTIVLSSENVYAGDYSGQLAIDTGADNKYDKVGTASVASVLPATAADVSFSTVASTVLQGISGVISGDTTTDAKVAAGTLTTTVTATVLDADGDAVGAGRSVAYSFDAGAAAGTIKVNGYLTGAAKPALLTDANGQVSFVVTDTTGTDGKKVTITATPEGIAGAASKFSLEWDTAALTMYDLNTSSSTGLATSSRTVAAGTSYVLDLVVADQFFNPAAAADYRLAVSGSGVTEGFVNLVGGRAQVTVTDSGVATSFVSNITLQKKSTAGVWGNTTTTVALTTNTTTKGKVTMSADASAIYGTTADLSDAVASKALVERDTRLAYVAQPAYTSGTGGDVVVVGKVTNSATGAAFANSVVTVSGPSSVLFSNGAVDSRGSITVISDGSGQFAVTLYSTTAQTDTVITATANGASATSKVSFTGQGVGEGTSLTLTVPAAVKPASTFKVSAKLADAYGNAVDTAAGSIKVTHTGPGIVYGTLPTETDAFGELAFSVLLGSNDSGDISFQVQYDQNGDGDFKDAKDLSVTKTVVINATGTVASADQKVNAGSFKGYVALYAKGYAGKRMSAKVGNDWVVVPVLASNFERVVEFTGAGYTVAVRIYIDRVLIDTITVTTK